MGALSLLATQNLSGGHSPSGGLLADDGSIQTHRLLLDQNYVCAMQDSEFPCEYLSHFMHL
jgi:hypothetical protein